MSEGEERAVRAVIRGRVQGVGFRAWTMGQAELHGLSGWVRNRRDGTVEAVFRGRPEALGAMLKACRQGPRGCRVEQVEEHAAAAEDLAAGDRGFSLRPTL